MFITSRTQTQVNTMRKECPDWVTDQYELDMDYIHTAKTVIDWVDRTWDDDALTLLYLLTAQCHLMAAMSGLNAIDVGLYEEQGFYLSEVEFELEYHRAEVLEYFRDVKEAIQGILSARRQLVQA